MRKLDCTVPTKRTRMPMQIELMPITELAADVRISDNGRLIVGVWMKVACEQLLKHLAEDALHGFQVTLAAAPREHHDLRAHDKA